MQKGICAKFALWKSHVKYKICTKCKHGNDWICKRSKLSHCHFCTGWAPWQISYCILQQICTTQTLSKFDFSSYTVVKTEEVFKPQSAFRYFRLEPVNFYNRLKWFFYTCNWYLERNQANMVDLLPFNYCFDKINVI